MKTFHHDYSVLVKKAGLSPLIDKVTERNLRELPAPFYTRYPGNLALDGKAKVWDWLKSDYKHNYSRPLYWRDRGRRTNAVLPAMLAGGLLGGVSGIGLGRLVNKAVKPKDEKERRSNAKSVAILSALLGARFGYSAVSGSLNWMTSPIFEARKARDHEYINKEFGTLFGPGDFVKHLEATSK